MKITVNRPVDLARTFSLIARPDTHHFLERELPAFLASLTKTRVVRFRKYFKRLRSGEYIPKAAYSDKETNYVYLTVGQFSKPELSFENLTFLDESVGKRYESIRVNNGDLVVTRSGTVGVVHRFTAPDTKIYIPSHHLAIIEVADLSPEFREYLRLFLQSEFPRKYFWAFASGKDQKEISNWSIKSIPIPQCDDADVVAGQCRTIEGEIQRLKEELEQKLAEKDRVLYEAIRKQAGKVR